MKLEANKQVLVIRQRYPFRGNVLSATIHNQNYAFIWNKQIGAYAWDPPSVEQLNKLFLDVRSNSLFTPGLWIGEVMPEAPVIQPTPEPAPSPAAPEPVETPQTVENPAVPAEPVHKAGRRKKTATS